MVKSSPALQWLYMVHRLLGTITLQTNGIFEKFWYHSKEQKILYKATFTDFLNKGFWAKNSQKFWDWKEKGRGREVSPVRPDDRYLTKPWAR